MRAGSVSGTGIINVNGGSARNITNDANGGGGAGGSVLISVNTGTLEFIRVTATGGNGGSNTTSDSPHGPGGGGSGGVVLSSTTLQAINVNGGDAGLTQGNIVYGATKGGNGVFSVNTPRLASVRDDRGCAPTANNVTHGSIIPNTAAATAIVVLSATDIDGTIASFTITTLPTAAQGILLVNGTAATAGQNITPAQAGLLTFDPAATFIGTASFTFTAIDNDGNIDTTPATYRIQVSGNQPPVANDVSSNLLTRDNKTKFKIPLLNATDSDGTIVSYTIILPSDFIGNLYDSPTSSTAIINNQIITNNQLYYLTTNANYTPIRNFNYTATDNLTAVSNSASYTLYVDAGTTPTISAVANNITTAPLLNSLASTSITGLSASGGIISYYKINSIPSSGKLYVRNTANTADIEITAALVSTTGYEITALQASRLKYDPVDTFHGNTTFNFTATNSISTDANTRASTYDTTPATFTIPVKAAPEVYNLILPTTLNTASNTIINPITGIDVDGVITSFTINSLPTSGTLFYNGTEITASNLTTAYPTSNGNMEVLTFTPDLLSPRKVGFSFIATDNDGFTTAAPGTCTIPINQRPLAINASNTNIIYNASNENQLNQLDGSDDMSVSSFRLSSLPSNGTLTINDQPAELFVDYPWASRSAIKFKPDASNTSTTDSFNYSTVDDEGAESLAPAVYSLRIENSPLPVELISFQAKAIANLVYLNWATAAENDNDYFLVQRSSNGRDFTNIGQVKGNGFSTVRLTYSFLDTNPMAGTNYYRLEQVDFDGKTEKSKIISMKMTPSAATHTLAVAPNPFSQDITFTITTSQENTALVEIRSASGVVVLRQEVTLKAGTNTITPSVANLVNGFYIVTVKAPGLNLVQKIVKAN